MAGARQCEVDPLLESSTARTEDLARNHADLPLTFAPCQCLDAIPSDQNHAELALGVPRSQAAEKAPARGRRRSLPRTKSLLCHWPVAVRTCGGQPLMKREPSVELAARALNLRTSWGCLPPGRACLCLCFAGFHFNGSNLRMCRCHFYEVGVKKIYSLFQKAFFKKKKKRSKGRKVESLWGFYSLPHRTLPPPPGVISSLRLLTGGQSLAGREPVSP